jgi:glycosyltransferase involved in cell wall biosynthesis
MITSEDERVFCKKQYGLTDDRMHRLPYYLNLDSYVAQPPCSISEPVKFLFVGRLVPQKGLDILLPALAKVTQKNWTLTIVGTGREEGRLRAQAQALGLTERIHWQEPVRDMATIYGTHHVLLVPSRWEGFGIVGLEAQAAGIPVIGHSVGGLPEYIRHGITGYLVDATTSAWVQALSIYLTDTDRIVREQQAAKTWIQEYYAADVIAKEYYDWYTSIIS